MLAMTDRDFVQDYIDQSAAALAAFQADPAQMDLLFAMGDAVVRSLRAGGKLMIAGNGGSAGDAQHLAGEFTGRLMYDRAPLAAMALNVDTSALTAIGNDYGFDLVFERQVIGLGRAGDVLLGLSTSGNSPNVLRALTAARSLGMVTMGFTGAGGGEMVASTDLLLRVPSGHTPVIQQVYMVAGHIVCALVERAMYPQTR